MADDKTFTQAEVDSIVEGRLAREREKYADYDSLKDRSNHLIRIHSKRNRNGSDSFIWSFHNERCKRKEDLSGNRIRAEPN